MTAVGPRAVTGKSPLVPTGTRTRGQVPDRVRAARPRAAAGGFRGLQGNACQMDAVCRSAPSWRGGRVCGDSWLPSLRVLGNSSCTSEATAPGAGSLNPPLKFAFGGVLQDSGPDVSAIQFQGGGDCAPQPRCVAGTGTVRGCGLRLQGSSGAPEVGCA